MPNLNWKLKGNPFLLFYSLIMELSPFESGADCHREKLSQAYFNTYIGCASDVPFSNISATIKTTKQ